MRSQRLSTRATACAIALASTLALPALGQGTGSNDTSGTSGTTGTTGTTGAAGTTGSTGSTGYSGLSSDNSASRMSGETDSDFGFDWGWLGLLGLAGLMGMRKTNEVVHPAKPRSSGAL